MQTRFWCLACVFLLIGCQDSNNQVNDSISNQDASSSLQLDANAKRFVDIANFNLDNGRPISREEGQRLRKILERYPQSDDALYAVTRTYQQWLDWQGLVDIYRNLPPTEERAEFLAIALVRCGRYSEAVELFSPLFDADPDNTDRASWYAYALFHDGQLDAAAEVLDRTVDRFRGSNLTEGLVIRGQIWMSKNEYDKAAEQFEKALRTNSMDLAALLALARVRHAQGDHETAERLQTRAQAVRNNQTLAELKSRRFGTRMAELMNLMNAKKYAECKLLIDKMMPDADPKQMELLEGYLKEIESYR